MGKRLNLNALLEKIQLADIQEYPFKHIIIDNFIDDDVFDHITHLDEILVSGVDDRDLISNLCDMGWKATTFPGCIASIESYLHSRDNNYPHEGLAFYLDLVKDSYLNDLINFFQSRVFIETSLKRFNTNYDDDLISVASVNKYLSGYEISPHPDTRRKALTVLYNMNTDTSEQSYHTHLCELKTEYKDILKYWKENTDVDREWIPWDWTTTVTVHSQNNSLLLFHPEDNTLHGVKLDYNHNQHQRTQIYGNVHYKRYSHLKRENRKAMSIDNEDSRIKPNLKYYGL